MSVKRPGVLDTSLVLTLSGANALQLFLFGSRYQWRITPIVRAELKRRETREMVDRGLAGGALILEEVDTNNADELRIWAEWNAIVDVGEAEAITLAMCRKYTIGIEDRQAQRALSRLAVPGCWINAPNLLLDAVEDGAASHAEADSIFRSLDSYRGYAKRGIIDLASLQRRR